MVSAGHHLRPGTTRFWRWLIGTFAAYSLVLHGFAFAIAASQLAAAASDDDPIAVATCLHDAGSTPASPLAPGSGYCDHCAFCIVGGHHVLGAPAFTPLMMLAVGGTRLTSSNDWHLPTLADYRNAQPRGPPFTA